MPRRSHSLAIALCASLVLHGAIVYALARAMIASPIWLAGWARQAMTDADTKQSDQVFFAQLSDTPLGADDGAGHAIDAAPGETPLEARPASPDPQVLSRDPEGFGKVGDQASPSL